MLMIAGHIRTDPSAARELADDLRAGVARTLKEDGCLAYSFALDDEAAGSVLVLERWRDEAALSAHLEAPEIADLLGKWHGRLTLEVSKYDLSNERGMAD